MGDNKGKQKWYVEFDFLEGIIKNAEISETNFGNKIKLSISDGPVSYVLSLAIESSYGKDFITKMNNLDLSKPVYFFPWTMTADAWTQLTGKKSEKGKSGLTLKQDGEKIAPYYTKDDPKGMPEIVEKRVGKQVKWDDTDRLAFFYDELDKFVEKVSGSTQRNVERVVEDIISKAEKEVVVDDLPF